MNMVRFHKDVWELHRKLHHRFLKFARFITSATKDLPEKDIAALRAGVPPKALQTGASQRMRFKSCVKESFQPMHFKT